MATSSRGESDTAGDYAKTSKLGDALAEKVDDAEIKKEHLAVDG